VGSVAGPHQPKRASLLSLFLQSFPKLRYLGLDTGVGEFIDGVSNNFLARLSQQFAGSSARVLGSALIVGNENGR
jgi:hypothetical protein